MAWTQADLDNLDRLIATGVKVAEFRSGDRTEKQEFRSYQEMIDLRARMAGEIARSSPSGFSANRTVGGYDNGL